MFNFDAYIVVVALVAATLWFIIGLARLNHTWWDSQRRTANLRQQKLDMAKALLQSVEEIMQLEREAKETRKRAEMLEQGVEIKKKELTGIVPPPPPAIYVTSEYPPSSRDHAYSALLRRTGPKSRRADEPSERYVLVWATDNAAAQGRAQQALAGHPGFSIEGAMRYT